MTVPPLIPAPTTSTAVDVDLVDDIRDLLSWSRVKPAARMYGTQQLELASGGWTAVGTGPAWDTQFNTDSSEITPLVAGAFRLTRGVWRFDVTVSFFTGTATAGGCWVALRDLGTSAFHLMGGAKPTGVSGEDCVVSGSFPVDSNDSLSDFQLSVKQTSGVSAQVSFHQFACEFVAAT